MDLALSFLAWASVINMALLMIWLIGITAAGDFIFRTHSRFFAISRTDFDRFHYGAMASYKMLILFFNLVPYLVLRCLL